MHFIFLMFAITSMILNPKLDTSGGFFTNSQLAAGITFVLLGLQVCSTNVHSAGPNCGQASSLRYGFAVKSLAQVMPCGPAACAISDVDRLPTRDRSHPTRGLPPASPAIAPIARRVVLIGGRPKLDESGSCPNLVKVTRGVICCMPGTHATVDRGCRAAAPRDSQGRAELSLSDVLSFLI